MLSLQELAHKTVNHAFGHIQMQEYITLFSNFASPNYRLFSYSGEQPSMSLQYNRETAGAGSHNFDGYEYKWVSIKLIQFNPH
jgi:hypothetical protein